MLHARSNYTIVSANCGNRNRQLHPVALLTAENMDLCVRHGLGHQLPLEIRARTESYGIVTRRDAVLSPAANLMVAALRQVAHGAAAAR